MSRDHDQHRVGQKKQALWKAAGCDSARLCSLVLKGSADAASAHPLQHGTAVFSSLFTSEQGAVVRRSNTA